MQLDTITERGFLPWDLHFINVYRTKHFVNLIHWDADYDKDLDQYINPLLETHNGLNTNIVSLYTPVPHQKCFTDLNNSNFRYIFIPELLFLEVQRWIDFEELPSIGEIKFNKTFCFLNNRPTASRKILFYFFQENNLLDISYASYLNYSRRGRVEDQIESPYKNFKENIEGLEISVDICPIFDFYPVTNFLFDVCAETYCLEDFIGLTEKSIKPFLWGHIPLIFANSGTYKYLENLGFDVFRDIVDLGFDNETDNNIRMWRFQQEVLRLSKIPLENYNTIQLESRFHNNRNIFVKNVKRSIQALDWIEQEIDFMIENREQYLGFNNNKLV